VLGGLTSVFTCGGGGMPKMTSERIDGSLPKIRLGSLKKTTKNVNTQVELYTMVQGGGCSSGIVLYSSLYIFPEALKLICASCLMAWTSDAERMNH
jgi:hypothetical protein